MTSDPAPRRSPAPRRPADLAFAAAACAALAGYNNLAGQRPWHRRWYPAVNACAAAIALGAAAAAGLTADDLGLSQDKLRPGLRRGAAAAAPVVTAFALAALTPATRPLLNDERVASLTNRQLAYQVLLRIPVGTVAWEEIAFRGVLQAALRRVLAEPAATAVASVTFGLWHIRPTAEALALNRLAPTRGARIAAVTAVAAGTAAAGALLSVLRERSGSLVAPVLVHLAANSTAPLASALARRINLRSRRLLRAPPYKTLRDHEKRPNPPRTPPGPGRNAGRTRARSRAGG